MTDTALSNDVKIAVLITWFGKFPRYFNYFLLTCSYNRDINFIIFTDNVDVPVVAGWDNISFHHLSLDSFNRLATAKLGRKVNIADGYKLCDFKPMYGKIYEDFIVPYEFWGFCDVDVIIGDLSLVLTIDYLRNFDVISAHSQYLSGPFSLFRNIPKVTMLFNKSRDIERVVEGKTYISFDEAGSVMPHLWGGGNIFDVESDVESMTHLLLNPDKCDVRVSFGGFIVERLLTPRLLWNEGKLVTSAGEELAFFHYIIYKGALDFSVVEFNMSTKQFAFDKHGFFLVNTQGRAFLRASAFVKNFYSKSSKKLKKVVSKLYK